MTDAVQFLLLAVLFAHMVYVSTRDEDHDRDRER